MTRRTQPMRGARIARWIPFGLFLSALCLLPTQPSADPGVLTVAAWDLSDNGDDDGYADTHETVMMRVSVFNGSGFPVTDVSVRLVTDAPEIECLTIPTVYVGDIGIGEVQRSIEAFEFKVAGVERIMLDENLSVLFDATISSAQLADSVAEIVLDLDLDISGGSTPATFFEGFEGAGLGTFTSMHLDAGLGGAATDGSDNDNSDGYRCQYSDPNWSESNSYGTNAGMDCYLNATGAPDAFYWQTTNDRAFSGTRSLYFGIPLSPELGFTTPLAQLEAVRTTDPISLGWRNVCAETRSLNCSDDVDCPSGEACVPAAPHLTIKHQVSMIDGRTVSRPGETANRGVVMAQRADADGLAVGDWFRLEPYQNVYDQQAIDKYTPCTFDPIDDGNDEDSFFDPSDPLRRLGPSSICHPEFVFSFVGETAAPFDPTNVGGGLVPGRFPPSHNPPAYGPGLEGAFGLGTWVETRFDLSRYRGWSMRLRFLQSGLKLGTDVDFEQAFGSLVTFFNPDPGDDGWFIDDVEIADAIDAAAAVAIDSKGNSSLPGLQDDDGDGLT
jgi:hypothetical protein